MPDPITTILTTAIEHAPNAAAVAAAYKVAKDFLAKVAGPAVEEVGEIGRDYVKGWRAKNGSAVLVGADKLLAEAGREPQAVPLKTLLPLLDAASLEDEPTLAERWAALLANAADPAQRVAVQPGFISILRELTPTDALILHRIYRDVKPGEQELRYYELRKVITERFADELNLPMKQFALSVETLMRLRLCVPPTPTNDRFDKIIPAATAAARQVCPTVLGLEFLAAVTPPAS